MSGGRPCRLELRPEGHDRQDPLVESLGEELLEKFERRRVRPVKVLDHEKDGAPAGIGSQPFDERPERLFPLPDRRQAEGREAVVRGQRQQGREERHEIGPGQAVGPQVPHQSLEPGGRRLVQPQAQKPREEVGRGIENRVLEPARAAPFDDRRVRAGRSGHGHRRVR